MENHKKQRKTKKHTRKLPCEMHKKQKYTRCYKKCYKWL